MPKGQCKFNSTFLRDKRFKDWLMAVPGKNTEGKCKLCTSEFSTSYGCESAILSHANGQSHKHLVKAQENAQRSLAPMYFISSKTSTPNNSRSEQGTATSTVQATSTGATSTGATSTGATSTGATSTGATSTGATSTGATSTGATSTGATSTGATSTGATSTGATSTGATSTGATDSTTTDLQPSLSTTKHQLVVDDILNDALNAHAEICWVLKVASCYFSYFACLDLSKLFQIMFKDSKIAHYFKMKKKMHVLSKVWVGATF